MKPQIVLPFCLLLAGAQAQTLTTAAIQRYFNPVRSNLEASADVMPAEKYSYRLTAGQRTFAEWLNHSTERNYTDCATLKGETAPVSTKTIESLTSKEEVSKALKDSFAYCATALEALDDQKVLSSQQMSIAFLHTIVHNNEIYGNIVGYLRSSGIVPPSSAGRGAAKKK